MKVTNTGGNTLGFNIGGVNYTLASGESQSLNDKYTEDALNAVRVLTDLVLDYEEGVTPEGGVGREMQGTIASPIELDTATIVYPSSNDVVLLAVSSGGAVDVTSLGTGLFNGQRLTLIGTSDTDYPVIKNGDALSIPGLVELKLDVAVDLMWVETKFIGIGRSL